MFTSSLVSLFLLAFTPLSIAQSVRPKIVFEPQDVSLALGETLSLTINIRPKTLLSDLVLTLNYTDSISAPSTVKLNNGTAVFSITGRKVVSHTFIEVVRCEISNKSECDLDLSNAYSRVSVLKSHYIDYLVIVVGWAYFIAWSVSFYPQIWLNIRRKSVIGLNFDFLFLNVVGFAAYTLYNVLIYWSPAVQAEYAAENPRSPLPVLLNDVVFAIHALSACIFTGIQAVIYERENQRVSRLCLSYGVVLVLAGLVCGGLSLFRTISLLQFVTSLSYIKMAVTLSKYFPQAIFNYQRKSTIGWSIGNVLLDFTGGSLDVTQMVLQAVNVDDFSAFSGNPVKFGLGLISMVFDVVFMIQHYLLYRHVEIVPGGFDNEAGPQTPPPESDYFDPESSIDSRRGFVDV